MPETYGVTNIFDQNLLSLSEEDIKNRYITPAIEAKGWTKNQTRMEFTIKENTEFTDGLKYHSITKEMHEENYNLRQQDCRFCIDFVIDSSLKLQEFDFDISKIIK